MVDHKADDLAVEKDDEAHGHHIANDEQDQNEETIFVSVGEIVKWACGQVTLCRNINNTLLLYTF